MKAFLLLIIMAIIGGLFLYTNPNLLTFSQCDHPKFFKLGIVDPKFGLNQTNLISDIQKSADVWSHAFGKPLFINSSTADLTINFIYDQRSALNSNINQSQDKLNQKITTLEQLIKTYESDIVVFEKKLTDFNNKIYQINQAGGTSGDEYNRLIEEQKDINREGESLNSRAQKLNLSTRDYNSQVKSLNQNVNQFNQALVQKPEEGLYDPNNQTITIYFADNRPSLLHTLTHEFGHALGLDHTTDPNSIMYPYENSSQSLTADDKQALDYVCRNQTYPIYWWQQFSLRLSYFLDTFS